MKLGRLALSMGLLVAPLAPSHGRNSEPPFFRTGLDLVESCQQPSLAEAYRCSGRYEAIADATEAGRWKDQCAPIVEAVPQGQPPSDVRRMLEAAQQHPAWLSLPVVAFVDKVERLARCHQSSN